MLKKSYLGLSILVLLILLSQAPITHAGVKGMNLFNDLGNKIENLEDNKRYYKERLLVIAGDQKISTDVNQFLTTATDILPPQTYQMLLFPLAMARLQNMALAKIKVKGFDIASMEFSSTLPTDFVGLASVVLEYEGDNEPLRKLITNIRVRDEQKNRH